MLFDFSPVIVPNGTSALVFWFFLVLVFDENWE
jgi:hypothetical protein